MGSTVTISSPEGSFSAYLAPPRSLPAPAVVIIQEIFGVNADLRSTCDELALRGYLAISPDLFWRMEPNVELTDQTETEWAKAFSFYEAFDRDAGVADIALAMEFARSHPGSSGRVGLMGFCLGGLMTFLTTVQHRPEASVVFYGGGVEKHLDASPDIATPLLMHLGEEDEYIPRDARLAIVDALASNPHVRVLTYPGCSHAFARHGGTHYDRHAADLANKRTFAFFDTHLNHGTNVATPDGGESLADPTPTKVSATPSFNGSDSTNLM